MSEHILEVKNLVTHFKVKKQTVKAVDDVSFQIKKGESFGIVGESGCGKSTLGRTIIKLVAATGGDVLFNQQSLLQARGADLREKRRNIQMIFQDPYAALDPRMTVSQILAEPFQIHGLAPGQERQLKIKQLLELVGLKHQDQNRYPHEFSGGQKQRICIARALALEPQFIICDEPVSALDVSIQAQILNILKDLQARFSLTYLFISHDLSVIEHFCDRVGVMYLGKLVELQSTQDLFLSPAHPYTKALLAAAPRMGFGKTKSRRSLTGELPSPLNPPTGCYFHPRCPKVQEKCKSSTPLFDQKVACWFPQS